MKTNVQLFNLSKKFRIVQICGTFRLQRIDTRSKGQIATDIRSRPNLSIIPALSVTSV